MNPNYTKLISIHKAANDQSLLAVWQQHHPARYSADEIGLETWKADVKDALDISGEQPLSSLLNGQISWNTVSAARSWGDISTLFPGGNDLREKWQSAKENKGLGAFLAWFDKNQPKTIDEAVKAIETNTAKPAKVKPAISIRHEEQHPDSNNLSNRNPNSDDSFYKSILAGVGAPVTDNNLNFLYGWRQAEGGHAAFNPFNTTQKATGATAYNSVGVKNYTSEEQGIAATIKTLKNGRYEVILSAMRADSVPEVTAEALIASPWGKGKLVATVTSGYAKGISPKPKPIARTS